MVYRIVTRKSRLARCQTELFVRAMRAQDASFEANIIPVDTVVDQTEAPVSTFGGKGSFVKELEDMVLSGFADCAVHSMKDMSVRTIEGLTIGCVLAREDVRDVLVSKDFPNLHALPSGSVVGTSSLRRSSQLMARRPDLRVMPCRGNVDTRLDKLARGDFQALVLAGVGLERLQLETSISEYFSTAWMLPAPAQAVIAVQCRSEDLMLRKALETVHHSPTAELVYWERKVVSLLGGHCLMPLAAHASYQDGMIELGVAIGYASGDLLIRKSCILGGGIIQENVQRVQDLCDELLQDGGAEILEYYTR